MHHALIDNAFVFWMFALFLGRGLISIIVAVPGLCRAAGVPVGGRLMNLVRLKTHSIYAESQRAQVPLASASAVALRGAAAVGVLSACRRRVGQPRRSSVVPAAIPKLDRTSSSNDQEG